MNRPEFKPPFGYNLNAEIPPTQEPYVEVHGRNKLLEKALSAESKLRTAVGDLGLQDKTGTDSFFRNQISPRISLVFPIDGFTYRLTRIQMGFEFTSQSWNFERAYILEKHLATEDGTIPEDSVPAELSAIKVSHSDAHIYSFRKGRLLTDSKPAWSEFQGMLRVMMQKPEHPWIAKP